MDFIKERLDLLDSADMIKILMINTLGLSVLAETFKSAAFFVAHSNGHGKSVHFQLDLKEGKSCLAFINGTGLNLALDFYALDYNPENLRSSFFYFMKKINNGHS